MFIADSEKKLPNYNNGLFLKLGKLSLDITYLDNPVHFARHIYHNRQPLHRYMYHPSIQTGQVDILK